MENSKRNFTLGLLSAATLPAWAQFGLPGLGGGAKSSGGADPTKIETDLKSIIETTSFAVNKLAAALSLTETATKAKITAEDIKTGKLGLADATNAVTEVSASVKAEMEKRQKEGTKLDAAASAWATEALLPALSAFPLWKSVAEGVKSLDRGALMSAASLAQAASKVPAAAKSTLDMSQSAIAYLSFSGADMTAVTKEVQKLSL